MHHGSQKIISYYIFYLFFPIGKRKEFKLFQLLESFKIKCANDPKSPMRMLAPISMLWYLRQALGFGRLHRKVTSQSSGGVY